MSNPQHEPTMEEILASIRKIISEDSSEEQPAEEGAVAPEPEPVAQMAAEPAPEVASEPIPEAEDILELTDEIPNEHGAAPELEPVAERADEIVFESIDEQEAVSEPMSASPVPVVEDDTQSEGIFTDKTRKALDDAFASLDEPDEQPAHAPAAPLPAMEGNSVEAVFDRAVRETFDPVLREWLGDQTGALLDRMKPVIREWMDQNFPPMLEEAVRNEVARVAKARRR